VLAAPFLAGADPGSRSMGPRNPTTGMPHLCGRGCSHSHGA
jgi:hypothetical protein